MFQAPPLTVLSRAIPRYSDMIIRNQSIGLRLRKTSYLLLAFSWVIVASACSGPKEKLEIREENYLSIKLGMMRSDLERMFGLGEELSRSKSIQLFGELESERFDAKNEGDPLAPKGVKWKSADYSLIVLFVEDKVVAKAESGNLNSGSSPVGLRE